MSINVVVLSGRVGRDPEVRNTTNGKTVASFSLAVYDKYADNNTIWVKCLAWEKMSEVVSKYVSKGSSVTVHGKLSIRGWSDRDGNRRSSTEVVVNSIAFSQTRGQSPNNTTSRDVSGDDW